MQNDIQKSLITALAKFHQELKDMKVKPSDVIRLMEEFKQAYLRSGSYDLAAQRVFQDVMQLVGKSAFEEILKDSDKNQKANETAEDLINEAPEPKDKEEARSLISAVGRAVALVVGVSLAAGVGAAISAAKKKDPKYINWR